MYYVKFLATLFMRCFFYSVVLGFLTTACSAMTGTNFFILFKKFNYFLCQVPVGNDFINLFSLYSSIYLIWWIAGRHTDQSPRSQLRKTGKVTQTSMFRTNKKALIFMRFEQNDFKILILSFKNHLHIF